MEFRSRRDTEFGVVVPDDAEAKMIRETGFLGGFGPRLYRVSENYILIRSAPGSELVLRSIRHLDSGARSSLVDSLKSLGFRDGIEISASSGFINMVTRANTPGDPLHAATMAMFSIRTPAEPMPQAAPARPLSRDATMALINEMLARGTSEAASADVQHGNDDELRS
jgi:hypothetical protein